MIGSLLKSKFLRVDVRINSVFVVLICPDLIGVGIANSLGVAAGYRLSGTPSRLLGTAPSSSAGGISGSDQWNSVPLWEEVPDLAISRLVSLTIRHTNEPRSQAGHGQ